MTDSNDRLEDLDRVPSRREYTPPRVSDTAEFETLAMTCGKTGGLACFRAGGTTNS